MILVPDILHYRFSKAFPAYHRNINSTLHKQKPSRLLLFCHNRRRYSLLTSGRWSSCCRHVINNHCCNLETTRKTTRPANTVYTPVITTTLFSKRFICVLFISYKPSHDEYYGSALSKSRSFLLARLAPI